jgi:DNA-directed RNA polymerase subunit RPC12/RpoP
MGSLRCPRPQCRKKMGDNLEGTYKNRCPRCGWFVTIVMRDGETIQAEALAPVLIDKALGTVIYR